MVHDQSLFSLAQRDCQYGVVIGHYAPSWTIAAQSVVGMKPIFSVHFGERKLRVHLQGSLTTVPQGRFIVVVRNGQAKS